MLNFVDFPFILQGHCDLLACPSGRSDHYLLGVTFGVVYLMVMVVIQFMGAALTALASSLSVCCSVMFSN